MGEVNPDVLSLCRSISGHDSCYYRGRRIRDECIKIVLSMALTLTFQDTTQLGVWVTQLINIFLKNIGIRYIVSKM